MPVFEHLQWRESRGFCAAASAIRLGDLVEFKVGSFVGLRGTMSGKQKAAPDQFGFRRF
jgi:hypothetical protein